MKLPVRWELSVVCGLSVVCSHLRPAPPRGLSSSAASFLFSVSLYIIFLFSLHPTISPIYITSRNQLGRQTKGGTVDRHAAAALRAQHGAGACEGAEQVSERELRYPAVRPSAYIAECQTAPSADASGYRTHRGPGRAPRSIIVGQVVPDGAECRCYQVVSSSVRFGPRLDTSPPRSGSCNLVGQAALKW